MTAEITANDEVLVLPAVADLSAAQSLFESLREHIAIARNLTLDGGAVDRISTPCVQILVAAARAVIANGATFRIVDKSAALSEAFQDLGLENWLEG